jgi:UDP-N-acetyl-alpha-D-muramoyl-L-alanyl-L-glutamate epimerase
MSAFHYESFSTDAERGILTCRYSVAGHDFTETVTLPAGERWDTAAAQAAARWVFLLAGVSYYKTAAPDVIDLGDLDLTDRERTFLREYYLNGLGEFAYRNNLDLSGLTLTGGAPSVGADGPLAPTGSAGRPRALVPFGGGIDSIVTVEMVRPLADAALFVVSRPGDTFDAIEAPASVTGLPIIRAGRQIDPQLFRSKELGFLNGHIPVTGILSAIAILAAVLDDRDAVVMSNEWSASIPTLEHNGRQVNHQWSKSDQFERGFREVLAPLGLPDYFSALRDRTELWVGERFAELGSYHSSFRSCNRAFQLEKSRRLDHWCGECDKCCFIDLILAPFMSAAELSSVFDGREPLDNSKMRGKFESLLGSGTKPFECVGEVNECRAAVVLAATRADRADTVLLRDLGREVTARPDVPTAGEIERMREPVGENFVPEWLR